MTVGFVIVDVVAVVAGDVDLLLILSLLLLLLMLLFSPSQELSFMSPLGIHNVSMVAWSTKRCMLVMS